MLYNAYVLGFKCPYLASLHILKSKIRFLQKLKKKNLKERKKKRKKKKEKEKKKKEKKSSIFYLVKFSHGI